MPASTSSSLDDSYLAIHGKTLAGLLRSAKSKGSNGILKEVEDVINQLLIDLSMDQGLFIDEALAKVVSRIHGILKEISKLDSHNATRYEELAKKVKGFKSFRQSLAVDSISEHYAFAFDRLVTGKPEPTYENLSVIEKHCLLWFTLLPDGMGISRRELKYWWVGMGFIDPDGGKFRCGLILRKLEDEDFIECVTNKKGFNIYRMRTGVCSKVMEQAAKEEGLSLPDAVMPRTEWTLEYFIKLDSDKATRYKKLAENVKCFKSLAESTAVDSCKQLASIFDLLWKPGPESDFDPTYGQSLSDKEKQCLLWFCLFPEGTGISKRELIYWWVGMGLVDPRIDGGKRGCDVILGKLVADDLIERAIKDKKAFNVYRMCPGLRSKVMEQARKNNWSHKAAQFQKGSSFSVIYPAGDETADQPEPGKVQAALLNTRGNKLDAVIFDSLSKMKNVKVVHLGLQTWHHEDAADYIVSEDDIEFGKVFRHLGQVTCLSFQGISGIVKLPDSVCNLENLRVLDLGACNNLELLPEEIGSLHQLTHLDLSKCYLLDHIPKRITELSELRVLKGFIISADPDPQNANNGNLPNLPLCGFSDLSNLIKLTVLTVRTRRMDFPTSKDFQTLHQLPLLSNLRIAWVGSPNDVQTDGNSKGFPKNLKKLELEAAPERTASRLLGLIKGAVNCPEKLYIRGGQLEDLGPEKDSFDGVKVVHLRHLPKLRMGWCEFVRSFPKLTRLEISRCPNLILFPCDENGVWEQHEK